MLLYFHTSLKEHDVDELWTGFSQIKKKLTTTTALCTIVCVVQQLIIITILKHGYDSETLYNVNCY